MRYRTNFLFRFIAVIVIACQGCAPVEIRKGSNRDSFEMLWRILDERYCFFDIKGVDWNAVYDEYSAYVDEQMSDEDFFVLMSDMVNELKDGHVNLKSTFNTSFYTAFYDDYPQNFYSDLLKEPRYLGKNYMRAGGISYRILSGNIGYMYIGSFTSAISTANVSAVLNKFAQCQGIIVDVRGNSGGDLLTAEAVASSFVAGGTKVGYVVHKCGPAHSNFSEPIPKFMGTYATPRCNKKVALLTNRQCYSATNDFVAMMRIYLNTVQIGDQTGGGSGLPMSAELPNGWTIRYSASPIYNIDMEQIEEGIAPDIAVSISGEDRQRGIDSIIEAALSYLSR